MLINEIERKREQLIDIIKDYGLTSVQTLKCSQELDYLIKAYQQEQYNLRQIKPLNSPSKTTSRTRK